MPGPVALTGATGFIGNAVLNRLTKEGQHVRALTRQPRRDTDTVQWIRGDLDNHEALQQLVSGTSAVVHCAGCVRGGSLRDFTRVNVDGTVNISSAAAQETPSPRFLLVSSLAAREPQLSWYATSKLHAEQALARHAGDLAWSAFRPTAVYGPGDKELAPLLRMTRYGILPMAGRRVTRVSLLHVDDLAAAIMAWLAQEEPARGVFELDDGTPDGYDRHSLAAIAARAWGRPVRAVSIPETLLFMTGSANLWLSRLLRYSPMLTPGKVRELLHHDWVCDNTPLIRALQDWQPRVRLRDALRASI